MNPKLEKNLLHLFRKHSFRIVRLKIFGNFRHPLILILVFIFSLLLILDILPQSSHARTIWRIGDPNNNSSSEFGLPGFDQEIISYAIPGDWNSGTDWSSFPQYLCPVELNLQPIEIHITSDYLKNYRCPILRISARSDADRTQKLIILKGKEEIPTSDDNALVGSFFSIFEFPLGLIETGQQANNLITIKNEYASNKKAIFFDYLELDDQDNDGDWSLNAEESNEDTDGDGIEDMEDADTASLLLQSQYQPIKKKIILDIEESEDFAPYFQKIYLIDGNSSDYPPYIQDAVFFPYDLFKIEMQVPSKAGVVPLRLIFPEALYPSLVQFYLYYNEDNAWQKVQTEIADENSIIVSVGNERTLNRENKEKELDGLDEKDYNPVSLIGGLAYPVSMNFKLEKSTCFISSLQITPLYKIIVNL